MPVYFDNATTSFPKPEEVYRAVENTLRSTGGTPGRSSHTMGYRAEKVVFNSREIVARFFNITNSKQIVFTSHATEATNLALKGFLQSGDHVITSSIDHSAVIRPLNGLKQKGVTTTIVRCSSAGELDPLDIKKAIQKKTRLIALTHASNVVGTISPVKEIGKIAQENNIVFLLDAAQTAGVFPVDIKDNHVDMLVCTGHKGLLGPQGVGFLYLSEDLDIEPLIEGGTGSASDSDSQPHFLPDRFQSGTINTPGIAGLVAGINFIEKQGLQRIRKHEMKITERVLSGLQSIDNLTVYGLADTSRRTAVISFTIDGIDPGDIAREMDETYHIMSRVGLHCSPHAHRTIGTFPQGTVRLSPGFFNTLEEADFIIDSIAKLSVFSK